jgi:hypothetical protein
MTHHAARVCQAAGPQDGDTVLCFKRREGALRESLLADRSFVRALTVFSS